MPENPPPRYPRVAPYLLYEDPAAALAWLADAFGFRERFRHENEAGVVDHAEMELEDGLIMLGNPGSDYRSPRRLGGTTAVVHAYVDDITAHFERAKAAGAEIEREPSPRPYGTIQYSAVDPEGQVWIFSEQVAEPEPEWRVG